MNSKDSLRGEKIVVSPFCMPYVAEEQIKRHPFHLRDTHYKQGLQGQETIHGKEASYSHLQRKDTLIFTYSVSSGNSFFDLSSTYANVSQRVPDSTHVEPKSFPDHIHVFHQRNACFTNVTKVT